MAAYTIRPERRKEAALIYQLVKTAFATAQVADGDEQDFVNQLRAGESYLPELALVAESSGALIGHIMLTAIPLRLDAGNETRAALLLAPLSVRLESRGQGVGSALVREACKRALEQGYTAVFLAGDPAYYGRFGFRAAQEFGIRHTPETLQAQYVLACELIPGALAVKNGLIAIV